MNIVWNLWINLYISLFFSWFLANLVASHPVPASSTQSSSREGSVQKESTPMDVYEQQQVSEDVVPDLADAMAELEMSETEKDKKDQ